MNFCLCVPRDKPLAPWKQSMYQNGSLYVPTLLSLWWDAGPSTLVFLSHVDLGIEDSRASGLGTSKAYNNLFINELLGLVACVLRMRKIETLEASPPKGKKVADLRGLILRGKQI